MVVLVDASIVLVALRIIAWFGTLAGLSGVIICSAACLILRNAFF